MCIRDRDYVKRLAIKTPGLDVKIDTLSGGNQQKVILEMCIRDRALGNTVFAADKVKIGFLLKTMQEERYQHDKADFIAKAEAMGAEVVFDSANNDEQAQLAKFENMLSKGCKVIVLQPVNTGTCLLYTSRCV